MAVCRAFLGSPPSILSPFLSLSLSLFLSLSLSPSLFPAQHEVDDLNTNHAKHLALHDRFAMIDEKVEALGFKLTNQIAALALHLDAKNKDAEDNMEDRMDELRTELGRSLAAGA